MLPAKKTSIYFDNNATTRLLPEVREALHNIIDTPFGNPSSPHSYSDYSRSILQKSRGYISQFLKCFPDQIIFTSGASESNTTIFNALSLKPDTKHSIITTPSEHSSVTENCRFLGFRDTDIRVLQINRSGVISLTELADLIEECTPTLISIGWASNETGVIQPIKEITEICKIKGILFHTDASQYIGRGEIDLSAENIDFLSFTGHKLHSPQGIGCLYVKNPDSMHCLIRGGEQEHGLRAGTENIIGIAGLGKAINLRMRTLDQSLKKLKKLRNHFEKSIVSSIPNVIINGVMEERTPNTSNITFSGIDGRALLAQLDIAGVICSQTSACTSMIPEPSETLRAMGLSVDEAFSSLRFSFAVDNTMDEVDRACVLIKEKIEVIRKFYVLRGAV